MENPKSYQRQSKFLRCINISAHKNYCHFRSLLESHSSGNMSVWFQIIQHSSAFFSFPRYKVLAKESSFMYYCNGLSSPDGADGMCFLLCHRWSEYSCLVCRNHLYYVESFILMCYGEKLIFTPWWWWKMLSSCSCLLQNSRESMLCPELVSPFRSSLGAENSREEGSWLRLHTPLPKLCHSRQAFKVQFKSITKELDLVIEEGPYVSLLGMNELVQDLRASGHGQK